MCTLYDLSKKLSLKSNFTSGVQHSLNFRTFNRVVMFSFCNAAVIILAQLTVVKVALKIIIVSSLKVHSKELGGCGHFVDKAKSCWPLLPLCPPVLLFVLLLLLLLHHHLYTVSTASHVTGVLSANNQRLIILPQHLVLPRHASALLLCVLASGPVGGYSMFFQSLRLPQISCKGHFVTC